MKNIIILAVVVLGGFLAWQYLPGLRTAVEGKITEYGGWTEEAREKDPVGFVEHAQKKLRENIETFEEVQDDLAENKKKAEDKLEEFSNKESAATEIANQMKELYTSAEATDAWPVTYNGNEYDRTELVDQVKEVLAEKKNAVARQTEYADALEKIDQRRSEIRDRISASNAKIDQLESQKLTLKTEKLTASSEEMLAQVNELVEGTTKIAEDPVRSLDELMAAAAKNEEAANEEAEVNERNAEALEFLNG